MEKTLKLVIVLHRSVVYYTKFQWWLIVQWKYHDYLFYIECRNQERQAIPLMDYVLNVVSLHNSMWYISVIVNDIVWRSLSNETQAHGHLTSGVSMTTLPLVVMDAPLVTWPCTRVSLQLSMCFLLEVLRITLLTTIP